MLSPRLLNRFRNLRLVLPGTSALQEGIHRQRSRGRSLEFSEHRDYTPGDDLRHLDWNVYARLERYVVKVFQAELEQPVYVLFDTSASMAGEKLSSGLGLAGALAFIALAAGDRAALSALGQSGSSASVRGVSQWPRLASYLQSQEARGQARLSESLRRFGLGQSRPGQVIVISDFLESDAGLDGLNYLLYQKHRLTLVQLLSPADLDPQLRGDVRLTDMEEPVHREVTVDARILLHYRNCLQQHNQGLVDWCRRHRCFFFQATCSPEHGLEDLVTRHLSKAGLVR